MGQLDPGGVELHLRAVEQGVVVGRAGGQLVQGVDHLDDIVQLPLGQGQGQVPRHRRRQGGPDEGVAQPVLVGADARRQIPEPLDQHAPRQHIGQGRDVLAVAVGLVEGGGEAVGHQQGEVGVLRAQGGVGVGVAVHRVDALHVFRHHVAVGVHAEGAHLVAVLLGAVHQLGLVHHVGDVLEHGGGQLHPHADVHLVVQQSQPQPLALVGEPLRPGAARPRDEAGGGEPLAPLGDKGVHPVPGLDLRHGGVEPEGVPVPDGLVDAGEDLQVVFRAQVLAPGLEQVQVVLQRLPLQGAGLRGGGGVDLGGGPVAYVQGVHVVNQLHDLLLVQEVGEPAAEGGGEVELAVGEGPRAPEAAHGAAHPALDAGAGPARHNGALAAVDVRPLVHHQHLCGGAFQGQLVGGVDARLAGA